MLCFSKPCFSWSTIENMYYESRAIATASTSTLGMYLPTNPDKLRAHLKWNSKTTTCWDLHAFWSAPCRLARLGLGHYLYYTYLVVYFLNQTTHPLFNTNVGTILHIIFIGMWIIKNIDKENLEKYSSNTGIYWRK